MAALPLKYESPGVLDSSVHEELRPLFEAIERRHPRSRASLQERLRGGDYKSWPDADSRAEARSEVHSLIDMIASRFDAHPPIGHPEAPEPVVPAGGTHAEDDIAHPNEPMDWQTSPLISSPQPATAIPTVAKRSVSQVRSAKRPMPFWMGQTLPITAVSVVALTTLLASLFAPPPNDPSDPIFAAGFSEVEEASLDKTEPPLVALPPAAVEDAPFTPDATPAVSVAADPVVPVVAKIPPRTTRSEPPEAPTPAPRPATTQSQLTPPPPARPVNLFAAPTVSAASATGGVTDLIEDDGTRLSKSEARLIGANLNSTLDTLVPGVTETLETEWANLSLTSSDQASSVQPMDLRVSSDVQLPEQELSVTVEWLVATEDAPLHRTTDPRTASLDRVIPKGAQIQKLAELTDDQGQAWALVGRHGVAIGFIRSHQLSTRQAFSGTLGHPYAGIRGYAVTISIQALTQCKTVDIAIAGRGQRSDRYCKQVNGNWGGQRLPVDAQFGAPVDRINATLKALFQSA